MLILKVKIVPSPLARTSVFHPLRKGRKVSILEVVRKTELSRPTIMMMKIALSSERKSPSPRDRFPEAISTSSMNRDTKKTTIMSPALTMDLHFLTLVLKHLVLCNQPPSRRPMLKTGMNSPIILATTRHAICANALSARPHASMMNDISQGLETITIEWMTALTVIGPITVASAAPTFQPPHQKSVVITIKDPHVEVQLKAGVVAQVHHEVSVNATGRAELVVGL
jgi:hypothetical protein